MSIRGIDRVQTFLGGIIDAKSRSVNSSADRDEKRDEQQRRREQMILSPAQIEEAFQALLETLQGSDLRAERHMENDKPHFVVIDKSGKVIRDLRSPHVVELYLKRISGETESQSGTLLKRSA